MRDNSLYLLHLLAYVLWDTWNPLIHNLCVLFTPISSSSRCLYATRWHYNLREYYNDKCMAGGISGGAQDVQTTGLFPHDAVVFLNSGRITGSSAWLRNPTRWGDKREKGGMMSAGQWLLPDTSHAFETGNDDDNGLVRYFSDCGRSFVTVQAECIAVYHPSKWYIAADPRA